MPREVVHIQVGQCGNQIGNKFWETIAQEHGLAPDGVFCGQDERHQLQKIDVYYHETNTNCYVPRAVLVDMDNSVLNHISQRIYGQMFRPENMLSTSNGAANNFMNGCYGENSRELTKRVHDCLRIEAERTDCLQGFTYSHSSAGGTGSGLTFAISNVASDLLTSTFGGSFYFTVFPSEQISNTVLEPYNSVMVLEKQTTCENVVCFDNEALYNICFNTIGLSSPTFGDMNRLVSMVMAGTTAPFRFSGQIDTDLNKLSYSLRTRPFMHFYTPSFAPLTSLRNQRYKKVTVEELVRQFTEKSSCMFESVPDEKDIEKAKQNGSNIGGQCFAYATLFRGQLTTENVDEALAFLTPQSDQNDGLRLTLGYDNRQNYILDSIRNCQKYVPNNLRMKFSTITDFATPGLPMSCTYLNNTSTCKFKFLKIVRQAMRMWVAGSFAHWYEKSQFEGENITGLEETLTKMCSEWIPEFGSEDGTNFPVVVEADEICSSMIKTD